MAALWADVRHERVGASARTGMHQQVSRMGGGNGRCMEGLQRRLLVAPVVRDAGAVHHRDGQRRGLEAGAGGGDRDHAGLIAALDDGGEQAVVGGARGRLVVHLRRGVPAASAAEDDVRHARDVEGNDVVGIGDHEAVGVHDLDLDDGCTQARAHRNKRAAAAVT